jgi:peptidoglycan/xylan/chitin deacetylase (PgdA/CDA1 family)
LLALKVDVDTQRGAREGAPALAALFERYQADATFLFSVGPDHTGRALRRVFRRGFLHKVARTSVLSHYGVRTLLYGTLLPGPHIGRTCAAEMRAVCAAGFEVGLHCYDHVLWQDDVGRKGADWTRRELERGFEAFRQVFGARPEVHGAAGWQMNAAAFAFEAAAGLVYASDSRGTHPFLPVLDDTLIACPQVPTTLPTLDELIGLGGRTPAAAAMYLLELTRTPPAAGHVFTLHAELEGMRLRPVLEALLAGWRRQGYLLVALRTLLFARDAETLPVHRVRAAPIPGRAGMVVTQDARVL